MTGPFSTDGVRIDEHRHAWARRRPVDLVAERDLGTPVIHRLQGRTPDATWRRAVEQANRLRLSQFAVGIELLPTEIIMVLTDPTGQDLGSRRTGLAKGSPAAIVEKIAAVAAELVETSLGITLPSRRVAIGVQIGAPIRDGDVLFWRNYPAEARFAVNPGEWHERVPLAALLRDATGCQTVVENDAAAYAVYEQRRGIGVAAKSFAVVLIRDGVGGGIVLDGHVAPIPFEIGHLTVDPGGRECSCRNIGCIESLAGRRAICGIIGDQRGGPTQPDGIEQAINLAESDAAALAAFRAGGEAIARGIASVVTLFGVQDIVVYCDPAMACPDDRRPAAAAAFFDGVATFERHVFPAFRDCRVVTRPWQSTDGAFGAAFVALNRVFFIQLGD